MLSSENKNKDKKDEKESDSEKQDDSLAETACKARQIIDGWVDEILQMGEAQCGWQETTKYYYRVLRVRVQHSQEQESDEVVVTPATTEPNVMAAASGRLVGS